MAATDTKVAIAKVAAQVQTIGQARAVLGETTRILREGYARLDEITSLADLRATARSYLDQVNAYAQRIYSTWNDDPDLQDEDISLVNITRVATCLEQARIAVREVEAIAETDYWDFVGALTEVLKRVTKEVVKLIPATTGFLAAMLAGLWPIIILGIIGLVAFAWARKKTLSSLGG